MDFPHGRRKNRRQSGGPGCTGCEMIRHASKEVVIPNLFRGGPRPMYRLVRLILIAFAALAIPTAALAQSAIAGIVKDSTGAVLPGVTVEASSPALIEKVKTAA